MPDPILGGQPGWRLIRHGFGGHDRLSRSLVDLTFRTTSDSIVLDPPRQQPLETTSTNVMTLARVVDTVDEIPPAEYSSYHERHSGFFDSL